MTKICTKCHAEKPLTEFNLRKASKDGYQPLCRECAHERMRAYRNTEEYKTKNRAYWTSDRGRAVKRRHWQSERGRITKSKNARKYRNSEVGKATISAYQSSEAYKQSRTKYRASYRGIAARRAYDRSEQGKAVYRKYRQSEKGRLSSRYRGCKYYSSEKGLVLARKKANLRRARLLNAIISPIDEKKIYALCNNQCIYCGSTERLTLDHVVALASGGSHTEDNLVVACKSCNSSKGKKPLEEWIGTRVRRLADGAVMRMEEAV